MKMQAICSTFTAQETSIYSRTGNERPGLTGKAAKAKTLCLTLQLFPLC